jgi:hypothetical protein
MSGTIRVSEKYGVNPFMPSCYYCGKSTEEIILPGRVLEKGTCEEVDMSRENGKVLDRRPCPKCAEHMKVGIIFISVMDGQEELMRKQVEPFRTGALWVVKREAVAIMLEGQDVLDKVMEMGWTYIPDKVAEMMGLRKTNKEADNG